MMKRARVALCDLQRGLYIVGGRAVCRLARYAGAGVQPMVAPQVNRCTVSWASGSRCFLVLFLISGLSLGGQSGGGKWCKPGGQFPAEKVGRLCHCPMHPTPA